MKKVKLSLDDLRVDSFVTSPGSDPNASRGTVRAQDHTFEVGCNDLTITTCNPNTQYCNETWNQTCQGNYGTSHCCGDHSNPGYESCGTTCQDYDTGCAYPCGGGITVGCTQGQSCGGEYTCAASCTGCHNTDYFNPC